MAPRQLILLDIYENNVYDIQQEMRLAYGKDLNLAVEIASVRDAEHAGQGVSYIPAPGGPSLRRLTSMVPLMEHNCSEAVKNNVFGTWNMVNASEEVRGGEVHHDLYGQGGEPHQTSVVATKRLCEMIVLSRAAAQSKTSFSCTRFGQCAGQQRQCDPPV